MRVEGWNIRGTHATGSERLQNDTAFTDPKVLRGLISRGGNRRKGAAVKLLQTGTFDSEDDPICEQKRKQGLL